MKGTPFGMAIGGELRLDKPIEAQVQQGRQRKLGATADELQESAIKKKIQEEVKRPVKNVPSHYSLWSSQ